MEAFKLGVILLLAKGNGAGLTTTGVPTFIHSIPILSSSIPIFDKDYLLNQLESSEYSSWLGLVFDLLSQLNHKCSPVIGCQKYKTFEDNPPSLISNHVPLPSPLVSHQVSLITFPSTLPPGCNSTETLTVSAVELNSVLKSLFSTAVPQINCLAIFNEYMMHFSLWQFVSFLSQTQLTWDWIKQVNFRDRAVRRTRSHHTSYQAGVLLVLLSGTCRSDIEFWITERRKVTQSKTEDNILSSTSIFHNILC